MGKILNIVYSKVTHKDGHVTYITKDKYRVVQYADDFVIFAKNKGDIAVIAEILNLYLEDRKLQLAKIDKNNSDNRWF